MDVEGKQFSDSFDYFIFESIHQFIFEMMLIGLLFWDKSEVKQQYICEGWHKLASHTGQSWTETVVRFFFR